MKQFTGSADGVRQRFAEVQQQVAEAARAAGRDPAAVRVLVATKYVAAEHLGVLQRGGHPAHRREPRPGPGRQARALRRRVRLPLHRPPAEPQGQAGAAAGEPHPFGIEHERRGGHPGARRGARGRAAGGEHRRGGEQERRRRPPRSTLFWSRPRRHDKVVLRRSHVHAAAVRRTPKTRGPFFARTRELAATAFGNVERNVYFRPAIDGNERRLPDSRARGRDHRACRQRALLRR